MGKKERAKTLACKPSRSLLPWRTAKGVRRDDGIEQGQRRTHQSAVVAEGQLARATDLPAYATRGQEIAQLLACHVGIGKLQACREAQSLLPVGMDVVEKRGCCRLVAMAEMAVLGKAIVNPLLVVALGQSVLIAGHETQVAQESLCVVDQTQIVVVDGGVGRGQRSLEVAETFQLKGLQLALGLIAVSLVLIAERHVVALETTGVVGAHLQVIAAQQGVVESPSGLGKGSTVGCQQAFGKRSRSSL